jgi:hypothetical protein
MAILSRLHFPLMAIAALSLLAALWAGLARLGWNLPQPTIELPANHGPLMIVGFLGTLISLERAVAVDRLWAYGAPLFAGLAALALLAGLPPWLGHGMATTASLFLIADFAFFYRQQPSASLATMGLGACLWFGGNLLWLSGFSLHRVVPWWIGFLVVTIAGERLELSRLLRLSPWDRIKFLLANGCIVSGLLVSLVVFSYGIWLGGVGLVGLAFWLLRYDIAGRTVRHRGLPRFMAVCLLCGYIWLGVGGVLWMVFPEFFNAGPYYDAMLHSILLGFVFSMIFAHAPVIFPSITGTAMPFLPRFYLHLALLHLSLFLRVWGGLGLWSSAQRWGGLLNGLAILVFVVNSVIAVRRDESRFSASRF